MEAEGRQPLSEDRLPTAAPGSFKVFRGREPGPAKPPEGFEGFGADGSSVDLWTYQELVDLMRDREWLLEWAWEQFRDAEERLPELRRRSRLTIGATLARHYAATGSSTVAQRLTERDHRDLLYEIETLEAQRSSAGKLIDVLRQQDSSLQTRSGMWRSQYEAEFRNRR